MEKVHKSSLREWISSPVNVRKFRDDWCAVLPSKENYKSSNQTLSSSELDKIKNACGLSVMRCPFQAKMEIGKEFTIPEGVELETLRLQKEDLEKRKEDQNYEASVYRRSKFPKYPPHKISHCQPSAEAEAENDKVEEPDVLLSVQIFRPEQKVHVKQNTAKASFQVDQEFMVLGSQYLTELRDKIACVSDYAIPGDCSEHPNIPAEMTCKDLYKSSFFYIDGIFYNDTRHPDCRDYSQIIIDWSEKKDRGVGPFKKAVMEETKFIDLSIQLGYPYVYVHQGNCEHLIVFSDLKMYTRSYSDRRSDYPLHLTLNPKKRVFCMLCHVHAAEWITMDNKCVPETPFLFCKQCFQKFNYDEQDQKIGNFKAYHYVDRGSIL